jgi:hypothetical protein
MADESSPDAQAPRWISLSPALTSYMVPSDEGPARRYYGITELGRTQLTEAKATWKEFTGALDALLGVDVEVTT